MPNLFHLVHDVHQASDVDALLATLRDGVLPAIGFDCALLRVSEAQLVCQLPYDLRLATGDIVEWQGYGTDPQRIFRELMALPTETFSKGQISPSVCSSSADQETPIYYVALCSETGSTRAMFLTREAKVLHESNNSSLFESLAPLFLDAIEHVFQNVVLTNAKAVLDMFEQAESRLWMVLDEGLHLQVISDDARRLFLRADRPFSLPTELKRAVRCFRESLQIIEPLDEPRPFPPLIVGDSVFAIKLFPVHCINLHKTAPMILVTLTEAQVEPYLAPLVATTGP